MRVVLGAVAFLVAGLQYLLTETISAAAWANPGYDYANNYISDLGVPGCGVEYSGRLLCSPVAPLMNAAFIVDGVLFVIAAVLLGSLLARGWRAAFLIVAALHGVGNVIVGLFNETTGSLAPGLPHTHVVGATLAILFGNVTAIVAGAWLLRAGRRVGLVAVVLGVVGSSRSHCSPWARSGCPRGWSSAWLSTRSPRSSCSRARSCWPGAG